MLNNILPPHIYSCFKNIAINKITEIRIRAQEKIVVHTMDGCKYLSADGVTENAERAMEAKQSDITFVLKKISNNSLYTINDQLINGYVSVSGGVRIGVAGEIVSTNGHIKTIKNITSLNIRIPHEIKNCSLSTYLHLVKDSRVLNTLILSPPGAGKTTFLRDFAHQIAKREKGKNILVVDERGEISGMSDGIKQLSIGNVDVYSNCKKSYAFENGIRSMKPDVIVTDELNLGSDLLAVETAITSGVGVVATMHASSINDLRNKKAFNELIAKKLFDRFVLLSCNFGPGTIEGVYNENLSCIYCG